MAETLRQQPSAPEKSEKYEVTRTAERADHKVERGETHKHKHEKDPAQTLKEAQTKVHEVNSTDNQENALEQLKASEKASKPVQPLHVNRELKSITLNRELTAIRRKLRAPQRALSKVIHQPVISAVSEPLSKTVSRPSGVLGGGLVAFLGTSGYVWLTKHYSFRYSYFVFLALFIGGFAVGLVLELLVHLATSSRRHAND